MTGKGSAPRPYSVPLDEYADNWEATFRPKPEPQPEDTEAQQ